MPLLTAGSSLGSNVTAEAAHLHFLESFNEDLVRLGCGVRVIAIAGSTSDMEIIDLDGAAIGRIPIRINPDVFAAFMRIVEQSFAEGQRLSAPVRPLTH